LRDFLPSVPSGATFERRIGTPLALLAIELLAALAI